MLCGIFFLAHLRSKELAGPMASPAVAIVAQVLLMLLVPTFLGYKQEGKIEDVEWRRPGCLGCTCVTLGSLAMTATHGLLVHVLVFILTMRARDCVVIAQAGQEVEIPPHPGEVSGLMKAFLLVVVISFCALGMSYQLLSEFRTFVSANRGLRRIVMALLEAKKSSVLLPMAVAMLAFAMENHESYPTDPVF